MKTTILALITLGLGFSTRTGPIEPLNDLEMAHVAVTASHIDIAYAHLALAFSQSEAVREFAQTMIRDHTAANTQIGELAEALGVQAQDNPVSQELLSRSREIMDRLSQLRGAAFDREYAANELAYHEAVNAMVADDFIPNVQNARVKELFRAALGLFQGHQRHAEQLNASLSTM